MEKLLRYNKTFIVGFIVLLCISAYQIKNIKIDYAVERYFPQGDPELDFLLKYENKLGANDNFLLVAIDNKKSIFTYRFLKQIDSLTSDLRAIPNILEAQSLSDQKELIKTPLGFTTFPVLHINSPELYSKDSIRLFSDPRWVGNFISYNATATSLILKTVPELPFPQAQTLMTNIENLLAKYNFKDYHIAGPINSQVSFIRKIKSELMFYIILCSVILLIILFFIYRKPLGIIIPLLSVIFGLIIFLGLLALFDLPIDIMGTLFPTLILIIGMSDVIHIMSKYIDESKKGHPKVKAMAITIKEIGFATLLTSLTTAIGFLALLSSRLEAIRDFGLYAAFGIFIAYFSVICFTTMVLVNFNHKSLSSEKSFYTLLGKYINKIFLFASKNQKSILITTVIVMLLSFWGISEISTNVFLLSDIPRNDKLWTDFNFFENKFDGVRPFEVGIIPAHHKKITDPEVLKAILQYEHHLKLYPEFQSVLSPLTIFRSFNKALNGADHHFYKVPEDTQVIKKINSYLDKYQTDKLNIFFSKDKSMGRISARIKDVGSDEIHAIKKEIAEWEADHINPNIVNFRVTGKLHLLDRNNQYLISGLFSGLAFAFIVVGLLMGLLFRNVKMLMISIIPNVIPLFVAGAAMGFSGIPLKASTSIIFTIAFGVAVDDTIHFLSRYKLERMKGVSVPHSVYRTFRESGKAIIFTTAVLLAGLTTLATSDFTATFYIGFLISITLFTALISDLLLLPILLYRFYRK